MMAEPEDDVYYDAISMGGKLTEKNIVPEVQIARPYDHSDITDALDINFTEDQSSNNKFHSDVTSADSNKVPISVDILTDAQKNTGAATSDQRIGRVLEIAAQFAGKPSGVQDDLHSKPATYFTEPEYRQGEQRSSYINTKPHPAFTVLDNDVQGKSAYCFAKPFPEDEKKTMEQIQTNTQATENQRPESLVDSIGYSHPNKFTGEQPQLRNEQAQVQNIGENQTYPDFWQQEDYDVGNPDAFTVILNHQQNVHVQLDGEYEVYDDQNLYDSVHNSLNRSGPNSLDFEVIDHKNVKGSSQSDHVKKKDGRGLTEKRDKMKAVADELKRQQARKKSRAIRRPSNKSGGNPFTSHSNFDDPHKGALPEADHEVEGPLHIFGLSEHHDDSDSGSSFFTDSTFDSTSDSEKEFFPGKPLPPTPDKKDQGKVSQFDVNQRHHRRNNGDEVMPILEKVHLKRPRSPPALPQIAGSIAPNQAKVRGVLQSLIDSERNYIASLERITAVYKEFILSHIKKPEVKVTFQKVEEIVSLHQMFQIELSDKLKKWNDEERIGSIFSHFSREMVIEIYSIYVNNYEVASEQIQEAENSKQTFREFIKKKQGESPDKLSLPALMLKPIQRFPQFIMIIKDLLKYTPRDHHDREELQEAVTWIENVAHQLNERKRQSEQLYHGQQIMAKLAPRIHPEKNVFLIRQDDMEQISHGPTRDKCLVFLTNKHLVFAVTVTKVRRRSIKNFLDQDGLSTEKYTYKWHQSLRDLDLTTSAITPSMQTTVSIGSSSSTIVSPKTDKSDKSDEDPYSVASELSDMIHDVSVLAQINQMVASLKLSYQGLTEDLIHGIITNLQKEIQGKDYQLQMLNSNTIIIQDRPRKKKYVFSAASAIAKQEWCIDFLLAKFALDITNIPSWHKPDCKETIQPALLMKHMSVDMQRTFTRISCGVKVYFPKRNEGSVEHLWVCSSTDSQGQVSIVSLHTDKPSLIESFQATKCEIICVESVPGFARVVDNAAFEEDTVWMSTADAVIQVFKLSEKDPELHRQCIHTFMVGCIVISMRYIDDVVFCGNRNGMVVIIKRDDDGLWSVTKRITLGTYPVISMICVGDYLWVSCGNKIHVLDIDELEVEGTMDTQCVTTEDSQYIFQFLVKIGVGVWASFVGQPNVCLYHSESRRLLQDVNVATAVHEFIKVYEHVEGRKNFHVTSLMASLGLLWIGTNVGIILVYPLPRLRDGVPRINERPLVALHSHTGPVKFLIPVHYGPVGSSPIKRRPESVLRKFNVDDTILKKLSKVDEHGSSKAHSDNNGITKDNFYEEVKLIGYNAESDNIYADIPEENNGQKNEDKVKQAMHISDQTSDFKIDTNEQESELDKSDEHKYFVLDHHVRVTDDSRLNTKGENAGSNGESDITIRPKANRSPQWHRSISLAEDASRKSLTLSHDSFRRKRDNVQSELAKKLKQRKSLEDLTDRDATQDEVGNLYPTLLRPQTIHRSVKNRASSLFDNTIPENLLGNFQPFGGSQDSLYYRPGMTTPILTRRPDITSTRNLVIPNSEKKEKSPSPEQKKKKSRRGERRSVSFNQNDTKESKQDTMENKRKTAVGTSFASGSSIDTFRKQGSNTIMVLSGGDGYKDWKKRQSLPNIRLEEPYLMFWMYRF